METVTIKLQESIMKQIDKFLRLFNYTTKTEFIREAIRDKLKQLETEKFMRQLAKYKGSAKYKYTDEEFRKIREKVGEEYAKELALRFK